MTIFNENDVIYLHKSIRANIIGGGELLMSIGALGTIVIVHNNGALPLAYEVEFFIPEQNDFALATVEASLVSKI